MANKQIHQLPEDPAPGVDDLIMLSKSASHEACYTGLSKLPIQNGLPNSIARTISEKAFEHVSVKDFGAVGDGISDDSASFAQALHSPATTISVPPGRYLLSTPLNLPAGKTFKGSGKQSTTLVSQHASGVITMLSDTASMCRSSIEGMEFEISSNGSGIAALGQDVNLRDLQLSGSNPAGWGLDMVDCRGAQIQNVTMGGPAKDFFASGMRWRDSTPQAVSNYGESAILGVDIRLGSENTIGIHLAAANSGLINNMLVAHARIRAPQLSGAPLAGTIGLKLDSTVRSTFIGLSLEALDLGVGENGVSNALGACVANQYFGVSAINVTTAYADSNAIVGRSVQQRVFAGCDNFPATQGLNDGDSIMPAGLWLQSFVNGDNAVRLRCFSGHELIVDDGAEKGSLALDVGGSSPRVAPKEAGLLTRLYLGRDSNPANNTMRDVTIEPVLRLAPRSSQNPGTTTGQFVYADGTNWDPGKGEGFYAFERGAWRKLAFEA